MAAEGTWFALNLVIACIHFSLGIGIRPNRYVDDSFWGDDDYDTESESRTRRTRTTTTAIRNEESEVGLLLVKDLGDVSTVER